MKLKGKTSGSPNQRRSPLRKIVQVLSVYKNSIFDRNLVLLECGHKTTSNGIYRARCWKCSDGYRALTALYPSSALNPNTENTEKTLPERGSGRRG